MAKIHKAQLVDALVCAFEPLDQFLEMYEERLAALNEVGDTPMECMRMVARRRIEAIAEAVEANLGRIDIEFIDWNYGMGGEISKVVLR